MARARKASRKATSVVARRSAVELEPLDPTAPSWSEELSEATQDAIATSRGAMGWAFLSTRGGKFRFNDVDLGDEIDVVILGARLENNYYTEAFDPNDPSPPSCFAIAKEAKDMAPPADLKAKENNDCGSCWANKFGSNEKGTRGKACRNYVRLAVLPVAGVILDENGQLLGDAPERIMKSECARLRIPPTAIGKNWSNYVNSVAKGLHRDLFEVVTTVALTEGKSGTGFTAELEARGGLPRILRDAILTRVDEAQAHLDLLPSVEDRGDADERGKGRTVGGGRRKVSRRPARRDAKSAGGGAKPRNTRKSSRR